MLNYETETLEFKKTLYEINQAMISLTSMLNTAGHGTLCFCVDNNGNPVDQPIEKDIIQRLSLMIKSSIKPTVIPLIQFDSLDGIQTIKLTVKGEKAPYSAFGHYFIRDDDQDIEMTQDDLESFFKKRHSNNSTWEHSLTDFTSEDVDERQLIELINKANECHRIKYVYKNADEALGMLSLEEDGYLNNACFSLLSTKKPHLIEEIVYATDEKRTIIDKKSFCGNIFDCIKEEFSFIKKNIRWALKQVGDRTDEIPEVPLNALYEIVLNSLIHKDYTSEKPNKIEITPGSISISNPGEMSSSFSVNDFYKETLGTQPRNPLIAIIMYLSGEIKDLGGGFKIILDTLKEVGISYSIKNENGYFSFIIKRRSQDQNEKEKKLNEKISNLKLTKADKALLDYFRQNDTLNSISNASSALSLSTITIQRSINKLVSSEIIKRIGSKKEGYWKLK